MNAIARIAAVVAVFSLTAMELVAAQETPPPGMQLPPAERIELDNGATLILVEKHDVPLIGVEAVLRGGAVTDPADKHGLAALVAGLFEKGAGDRSAAEFAEAVAAVGGELSAGASLEGIHVRGEFMARDAALMVELLGDMLRRPALAADEFTKLQERSINLIKAAKSSDPRQLVGTYAAAFLFGEHPYGNPSAGSEETLANIGHDDVQTFYREHAGADRLVIAVAGDFDSAAMRSLLTDAFADWQATESALPELAAPSPADGGRVLLVDKPGATQTYFAIGNVGVARDYAARADLDLANTVFGGRFTSMLMTELRVKSGLSYGARSALARYSLPGSVFVTSYTETGTTVEAVNVALQTLSRLHDEGLAPEMITSAQNYLLGQFPPRLETAEQLARQFAALEAYGLDVSYINDYGNALAAATPESIAAVIAAVYPRRDNLVFVMIGDAETIRDDVTTFGEVTEIPIDAPRFHP